MKRRNPFRPTVGDSSLEARLVLTRSAVPEFIVGAYVREFRTELKSISSGINNAITDILLGGNNSDPTPASRTAYDAQVKTLIDNAETVLDDVLALSPLAARKFTGQINDLLAGTGSTSLISQLNALTTPSSTGAPVDLFKADSVKLVDQALHESLVDLDHFVSIDNPLRAQIGHGLAPITLQESFDTQFKAAFSIFSTSYNNDVTNILLQGTDPANIPTNRPAFDTQVAADANLLNSDLANMLGLFPHASKSLVTSINSSLISGTNSMLDQLNALASPTDLNGSSADAFKASATGIINTSQTDVLGQLDSAFKKWHSIH